MSRKRVNDNEQYVIVHKDDMDTRLVVTVLEDKDSILVEIESKWGEKSFKLNTEAMDFLTSLLTASKRH